MRASALAGLLVAALLPWPLGCASDARSGEPAAPAEAVAPPPAEVPPSTPQPPPTPARPQGGHLDQAAFRSALDKLPEPEHRAGLEAFYGSNGYSAVFTEGAALSPVGQRLATTLLGADREALDPTRFHAARIAELKASPSAEAAPELELLLADGLLRYARAMRPRLAADEPALRAVQEQLLRDLGGAPDVDAAGRLLEALRPRSPQYARLMEALARYQAIVDAGGWPGKLPKIKRPKRKEEEEYKPGYKRYPENLVRLLKQRLAAERLYDGPIDDQWDDAFTEALRRYRKNNLLGERAIVDYVMIEAMKAPAAFRLGQIKLNLQRLREDPVGDADYYVYVNVPEYLGELWDKGERRLQFKVITGSRKKYRDKKDRRFRFPDATPKMTDRVERVVFNPSWTVPSRIRTQLHKEAAGKPNFWKENGYTIIPTGQGEMIKQAPGPNNALGDFKFLFPNDHDVYMHDTNRKDLFREEVRAFSHGCIRVNDPDQLAHYLLRREDESWTERRIRINAGSNNEMSIPLEHGPAVFLDYVTVRVDDSGEVIFLWDIYHRDIEAAEVEYGVRFEPDAYYP